MHAQKPLKNCPIKQCSKLFTTEFELSGANRHQSSVGDVSDLASCHVWEAESSHCGKSSKHRRKLMVRTVNVHTLRGRVCEIVETLSCREVDVCSIQETRCLDGNCHTIKGKDTRYKLYWSGNNKGTADVRVFVREEWIGEVFLGAESLRRNHLSEAYSWTACGYLSVCVCS